MVGKTISLFLSNLHNRIKRRSFCKSHGSAKGVFLSGFIASGFSIGNRGYGNAMSRTMIMTVVGGTAAVVGGGKFANGALTAAFVHMFNDERRVSISMSGGAGTGGTIEKGLILAHDDNQPWYKGWSGGIFTTTAEGAYADASISGEINFGWSDNNDIQAATQTSVTAGVSSNKFFEIGYEVSVGSHVAPMHNISIGIIGSANPIPYESHLYYSTTTIKEQFRF